jgi:flavin-dependent dehydrogenase
VSARSYDVAIVGAGLAGTLLARQLLRRRPELSIALIDRSRSTGFKVGESTVELASDYLVRRLGLSSYLYEAHLPKNGLRFFFDTPQRDGELEQLSELGSTAMPCIPSFQIDRKRFEHDMLEANRSAGVDVLLGAKVHKVQLSDGDGPHHFELRDGNTSEPLQCRWFVDASGRASLLAKQLDLRVPEAHPMASVWGRFRNVRDIDALGSAAWRARVRHTSRMLSTNHFCYPGYWIWFIPLGEGITSVGVVMETSRFDPAWRKQEGFEGFLRGHRAVAQLLDGAEPIDVMSYGQLAYGSKRFFSPQRWALVGESAAFSDPLYSPGSDFIAIENDYVSDLIDRDLGGASASELSERADLYDGFVKFRFDATMPIYRSLYATLGSYELFRLKWDFDVGCYYDLWLEPYLADKHLDAHYLRQQLRQRKLVMRVVENFAQLFQRVHQDLEARGELAARNLGSFSGRFPTMASAPMLGQPKSLEGAFERANAPFNLTRRRALELLEPPPTSAPSDDLPLTHFLAGKALL